MRTKTTIPVFVLMLGILARSSLSLCGYEASVVPAMSGVPSDFAGRRAGSEVQSSIRFGVTNEGACRITYTVLTNAGVSPASLIGADMRLFCRTQEVAISVSSTGLWSAADSLLFIGIGYDGYYTATNVYWLGFGPGGKRMTSRAAAPVAGLSPQTAARTGVMHHEDYYFKDTYRWDDSSIDHWVDRKMSRFAYETNFTLGADNVVTNDPATLVAIMLGYGSSDALNPDHSTRVRINGNTAGQFFYDGQVTALCSTNIPGAWLAGANTVGVQQTINGSDLAYVERINITYSRALVQTNNSLFFDGKTGTNNYQVTGFASNSNFTVFEATDPANPVILSGHQVTNMGAGVYAVLFGDNAVSTSRYGVCQTAGIRDLSTVQRTSFRDLAAANHQADYVVICPYAFRPEVYRLLKLRYLQGLSVAVAPLPDIYNEFSYGIADAAAIKQFIGYAYHHWVRPPKYILLAGSGTYNPRTLTEPHSPLMPDLIPVHLGAGNGAWVSLDGWFAAVNGSDCVPDVALGRLPVVSAGELKAVTDKIVSFEGVPSNHWYRQEVLMATDTNDVGYDFTGAADALAAARCDTNGMYSTFVRGTDSLPRQTIVQYLNTGVWLGNYFGHGDHIQWSGMTPPLLAPTDVLGLTNSLFPVVSMMTCMNGSFQGSKEKCLAAWFLATTNHGASACVAASGLASLNAANPFMDGFYGAMLGERRRRIGDALLPGYSSMAGALGLNVTELQFFELFGDPAMIVNP